MSTLTNAQILQIIASLRTQANTLEASLGLVKAEVTAEPKGRKERSDKGKSRANKPAADEEPPEDTEPKAKKEPKARKPRSDKGKPRVKKPAAEDSAAESAAEEDE